jgi:hypothetical protein
MSNSKAVTTVDNSILLEDSADNKNMNSEDLMIPRLSILQALSPQVNKRDGSYVEGAEAGFIFDNVANKCFDGEKGINVLPISYRRAYIEWKADRGGFVADHGNNASVLEGCSNVDGKMVNSEGNEIVTNAEYFVYVLEEDGTHNPAIISMSSSQLKKARRWNSMINRLQIPNPTKKGETLNPAMFWTSYKLTTVPEENDKGSWFGWNVTMNYDAASGGILKNLPNGTNLYLSARDFKKQVTAGSISASAPPPSEDPETL